MLQVFYELTPNVYTEMQTVRYKQWQVGTSAAVGQPHTGNIPFDDPGGTLTIKGWRKVRIYETTATPTLLWSGRIRNKTVKRGDSERESLRTGADRWWDCDAIDQNTLMGARIIRGTSANRPAETAGERLAWLLSTSFTIYVDNGHVTYPSNQLDPNDYTGQTAADVIGDCAQPGGYNYFALQVDDTDFPELFFMLPGDSDWASTISISDDPADLDFTTVFPPNYGAELAVADEIVASGVFLPYDGGDTSAYVYVSDSDIGDEFAFVDKAAPMANVKTSAKATTIANRHLALSATEAYRITCFIDVPAAQANDLRPWHRVAYKSTWMPTFGEYRDCRVIDWSIEQMPYHGGGDGYRIHLELSPIEDAEPASCSAAIAARETSEDSGLESGGNTASVSTTIPDDGFAVAILCGENGNTPDATGMGTPTGFTTLDARDHSRETWFIGYKAVTAGTQNTSATFTRGFGNLGVWLAGQAYLPWGSVSVVQEKFGSGRSATFDASPTAGNTILMFGMIGDNGAGQQQTPTPGGSFGPTTGWTELWNIGRSNDNAVFTVACWARCAEEGDGDVYDFNAVDGGLATGGTYIVELATT